MVDIDLGVSVALPRRRRRSAEERRLIVEEALEPEASVARVARKHGVNANQVFAWKRLYGKRAVETERLRRVGTLNRFFVKWTLNHEWVIAGGGQRHVSGRQFLDSGDGMVGDALEDVLEIDRNTSIASFTD